MIAGKKEAEILDAFEQYMRQRGGRCNLTSFLRFAGFNSDLGKSAKAKLRSRVDKLIRQSHKDLEVVEEKLSYGRPETYYDRRPKRTVKARSPQPCKVWIDPNLATWQGEPTQQMVWRDRQRAERWANINRDQQEERKAMRRQLKVKR